MSYLLKNTWKLGLLLPSWVTQNWLFMYFIQLFSPKVVRRTEEGQEYLLIRVISCQVIWANAFLLNDSQVRTERRASKNIFQTHRSPVVNDQWKGGRGASPGNLLLHEWEGLQGRRGTGTPKRVSLHPKRCCSWNGSKSLLPYEPQCSQYTHQAQLWKQPGQMEKRFLMITSSSGVV